MTEFTVYCLLFGLVFNITGIQHKFFPAKNYKWWLGFRFPSALRSLDTWKEANSFSALPFLIAGSLFMMISFLPEIFSDAKFFNFRMLTILFVITVLIIIFITDRHVKKNFDDSGN